MAEFPGIGSVMLASLFSQEFGKRLRAEREHLRLSLRQVQDLSRGIASQRKNSEYYIAHSSLADFESGKQIPNIYKLYTLSVIYRRQYEQLATLFDVPVSEAEKDHKALIYPQTYLVGAASEFSEAAILSSRELRERLRSERTNLLSKIIEKWKDVPPALFEQIDWRDSLYGYIGMEDKTLDPIIRPGSFVQIDPRQRTIPPVKWHDDFDRPIFFFELRERYVCSWCELYGSQLILVPTAHSHANARHIRYPDDATIVGRVTGVAMRIAEMREASPKATPAN
jgi:transcriptional regulator with XRE-family HTH domain